MYLSAFSLTEPEGNLYLYTPSWLNVWESHMYNRSLHSTHAKGWGFKRFGTSKDIYASEMIRTPDYANYIDAMEQVSEAALHQLMPKERMVLMKSRTAFIYADAWGESALFENITSTLHKATIDTLPKNLVKKFSVKDFTCKIRGEKQSLVQAMRLAEDYLNWQVFDFVVICAAYRAVPVLVFSEEDSGSRKKEKHRDQDTKLNVSVERVGCFIFSQREGPLKIVSGKYISPEIQGIHSQTESIIDEGVDLLCFTGFGKRESERERLINNTKGVRHINLTDIYGASGCLSPALSWTYLMQHSAPGKKIRTVVPDNFGGYNYFDTWYQGT